MSLYYEAAKILTDSAKSGGSLKHLVFGQKNLKSSPTQVYALIAETLKWNEILIEIVERSQLLSLEKKLTPCLALLLVHDEVIADNGIAAPSNHLLKLILKRNRARLKAEFTKIRVRAKHPSKSVFKAEIDQRAAGQNQSPRWVRINTLKTTVEEQMKTTFQECRALGEYADFGQQPMKRGDLFIDRHVSNLVALHPQFKFAQSPGYKNGQLVLQNKASCFPALLMMYKLPAGEVLDACAAPGNKTTHLAALSNENGGKDRSRRIWAIEKDATRSHTLASMVRKSGAASMVNIQARTDFLSLNPSSEDWAGLKGILLDPSCSGTGILGRDEKIVLKLPTASKEPQRNDKALSKRVSSVGLTLNNSDETQEEETVQPDEDFAKRLGSLSAFQSSMIDHALTFSNVERVVYSTCSTQTEENEQVVFRALQSPVARKRGWRILRRDEQPPGLQSWNTRGDISECRRLCQSDCEAAQVANACIRTCPSIKEGIIGFFAVGFVRANAKGQIGASLQDEVSDGEEDEGWEGFNSE